MILANYLLIIIFDSLVFFLTLFRTLGLAIDTKKMEIKSDFMFMFLRDGRQAFVIRKEGPMIETLFRHCVLSVSIICIT